MAINQRLSKYSPAKCSKKNKNWICFMIFHPIDALELYSKFIAAISPYFAGG
jgi:hypothetical protein